MEEVAQSFRLAGTADITEILCDHVDGQYVIHWGDIQDVFPGIKQIKKGNVIVGPMKDSEFNRIVPHRIKYQPGVVLDVVVSSSDEGTSALAGRNGDATSVSTMEEEVVESLKITQLSGDTVQSLEAQEDTGTSATFKQLVKRAQDEGILSDYELQLVSCLPADMQSKVLASPDFRGALLQAIMTSIMASNRSNEQLVAALQELQEKADQSNTLASTNNELTSRMMDVIRENKAQLDQITMLQRVLDSKQDEMKQLQIQALNQLALLQNNTRALLTQTYELHEYPVPRLFIVLPDESSSWNPLDFMSNKFRLYFLCECGEHTKAVRSNIPHHIHLAKHVGYDIVNPSVFFQKYGPYVLTILKMLKFGISVAGVAVPSLSNLIPDGLDQVTERLKWLTNIIEPAMDQVIRHIEKVSADKGGVIFESSDYRSSNEALEGIDLRQLESSLKNKDGNKVLGNLYRTVTTEGHVKWVCVDHYRENYHEKAAKAFRDAVESLEGSFDENTGRVEVILRSKVQVEYFFLALERVKSVYELRVVLDWKTSRNDFKRLRDALVRTNVGVLKLDLANQGAPTWDILNRRERYDPVLDIMRHPSIQSFTIIRPHDDFVQQSHLLSRRNNFFNLKYLGISLSDQCWDPVSVQGLLSQAPNLSSLSLKDSPTHLFLPVYTAIAEDQTYSIIIDCLTIPPMRDGSRSMVPYNHMAHLASVLGERLDTLTLDGKEQEEAVVSSLAKATESGFRMKSLQLMRSARLSDRLIKELSKIVAASELRKLEIHLMENENRVHILESIPWKHLRELVIRVKESSLLVDAMKVLDDSVRTRSIELENFWLLNETYDPLPKATDQHLLAFVTTASLKELRIGASMTLEQVRSLVGLVDVSRLERLHLSTRDLDSTGVAKILNDLQRAKELQDLYLGGAVITQEQKEQMKARGIDIAH